MSARANDEGVLGTVTTVHGNNMYRVELEVCGSLQKLLCHLSGKMLRHKINVVSGDRVRVDVNPPYDRGRITFRER
jgi:translation initiation factor IF-1